MHSYEGNVLIRQILDKLLAVVGIYIKHYYAFSTKITGQFLLQKTESNFNRPVVVIGREHCYECSRDLPIGRLNEAIKAAIMMDDIAPFVGKKFFLIESLNHDSSRLYFFVINQTVYEKIARKSWLILPESMLLQNAFVKQIKSNAIQASIAGREIFACKTTDGFKSVITAKDGSTHLGKIASYSAAQLDQPEKIASREYALMLIQSTLSLPRYCFQQSFNSTRFMSAWKNIPFRIISISAAVTLMGYLALSSAWLGYQQSILSNEIARQKNALETVFRLQKNINTAIADQHQLEKLAGLSVVTSRVWPILLQLVNNNTELLMVNFLNGKYTIRMKVNKSTDTLQTLSENKNITTPVMASPVVKNRGKEIMTIRFALKPKINEPKINEPKINEPKTDEPKTDEPKINKSKKNKKVKKKVVNHVVAS